MATKQIEAQAPAQYRDEEAWLEERRKGIGGSDVAALFGLHPFKTALDVYRDKVGEAPPVEPSPAMLRGRYLEDVAVVRYEERTGRRTRRWGMRKHREHPFLLASVDRQILAGPDNDTGPLEVKCPGLQVFWQIKRRGLLDYMILQGQHEALVWGYDYTGFAIFSAEHFQVLDFDVGADPEVGQRIVEVAGEFWEKHVLRGIPPEDTAAPPIDLPEVNGEVVVREDPRFVSALDDYFQADELAKEAAQLKDAAKARAKILAGDLGVFEGGDYRLYYRMQEGRRSFQQKNLAAAHPIDPQALQQILLSLQGERLDRERLLELFIQIRDEAELDLDDARFWKQGAPFETFRPYRLRGGSDE